MKEKIETLEKAVRELGRVNATLTARTEECSGCGAKRYLSWDEAQAKKLLESAIGRVGKAVSHLNSMDWKGK